MPNPLPGLKIVPDADWITYLAAHGITPATVAYWRITRPFLGNRAAPGAFSDGKGKIHVKASRQADRNLLMHELGHALEWAGHEHPRDIIGGFLHAINVGFDTRAFTSLLRWTRPSAANIRAYNSWRQILVSLQ